MESVITRGDKPEMNGREEWRSADDKKRTKPKGEGKAKSMTSNTNEVNTRRRHCDVKCNRRQINYKFILDKLFCTEDVSEAHEINMRL